MLGGSGEESIWWKLIGLGIPPPACDMTHASPNPPSSVYPLPIQAVPATTVISGRVLLSVCGDRLEAPSCVWLQ